MILSNRSQKAVWTYFQLNTHRCVTRPSNRKEHTPVCYPSQHDIENSTHWCVDRSEVVKTLKRCLNTLSGHDGNFRHIEFLPWGHSHILTSTHCPSINYWSQPSKLVHHATKYCYLNYCIILQNTAIFGSKYAWPLNVLNRIYTMKRLEGKLQCIPDGDERPPLQSFSAGVSNSGTSQLSDSTTGALQREGETAPVGVSEPQPHLHRLEGAQTIPWKKRGG